MAIPDRLEALRAQNAVTGIDFVYVFPSQTQLDVYFLNSPASLINAVAKEAVHIYSPSGGETTPVVPVTGVSWLNVGGREIMRLITAMPGDFSRYRLRIDDTRVDPYFNDVWFSFKANCESQLDCAPPPHECAPDPRSTFRSTIRRATSGASARRCSISRSSDIRNGATGSRPTSASCSPR